MGTLAVHAATFDEEAGSTVFELGWLVGIILAPSALAFPQLAQGRRCVAICRQAAAHFPADSSVVVR